MTTDADRARPTYLKSGGGFRAAVGRAWLRAYGWTCDPAHPNVKKAVVVAAPHTTGWDLPFTLAVSYVLGLRMSWVGKHTLFRPPYGALMRALGGLPVDRRARNSAVKATANLFAETDELFLIIAPEGTRGVAGRWKTGFYQIAREAKVPIVLGYLDYAKKRGGLGELFWPTGDVRADFEHLRRFYADVKGKHPERQGAISLDEN